MVKLLHSKKTNGNERILIISNQNAPAQQMKTSAKWECNLQNMEENLCNYIPGKG